MTKICFHPLNETMSFYEYNILLTIYQILSFAHVSRAWICPRWNWGTFPTFQNCTCLTNIWSMINNMASIWLENMLVYFSLQYMNFYSAHFHSTMALYNLELHCLKIVSFSEHIMSTDKHPSLFSRKMKATVYLFSRFLVFSQGFSIKCFESNTMYYLVKLHVKIHAMVIFHIHYFSHFEPTKLSHPGMERHLAPSFLIWSVFTWRHGSHVGVSPCWCPKPIMLGPVYMEGGCPG